MLQLNSQFDKPDFTFLYNRLQESMERGIYLEVSKDLLNTLQNELITANLNMKQYGITNPNSSKQVIEVLKELSKNEPLIKQYCYVKEKWSSNGKYLKALVHNNVQFAIDLLTYRRVSKYVSILNGLSEYVSDDGFVHPTLCGSTSNRIQYRNPGLLTIPKQFLWHVVKPRSDEWSLYSIDVKNQEPWILINMLGIEELKEILSISGNTGLYDMVFVLIYGHTATPLERSEFKKAWNSFTYGASKNGVVEMCFNIDSTKIYDYFNRFKAYKDYKSKMYASSRGGVKSVNALFGTKLTADGTTPSRVAKQLMDLPIQGTGAEILAFLVKHFYNTIDLLGVSDKLHIYFTRHDECIVEVHKSLEEKFGELEIVGLLGNIFEHKIDDWEPFKLEVSKINVSLDSLFLEDDYLMDDDFDD